MSNQEILSERTKEGMERCRATGKHISRPAVFMFAEDVDSAPVGRCILQADDMHRTVTKVESESTIYDYARQGFSYYHIAKDILDISPNVLYYAMMTPKMNKRGRGPKDRYTEFMRLYRESKGA